MDATGLRFLRDILNDFERRGIRLVLANPGSLVLRGLTTAGLLPKVRTASAVACLPAWLDLWGTVRRWPWHLRVQIGPDYCFSNAHSAVLCCLAELDEAETHTGEKSAHA